MAQRRAAVSIAGGIGKAGLWCTLGLACLVAASCGGGGESAKQSDGPAKKTGPLDAAECEALVGRALSNFGDSPLVRRQVSNCQRGRGTYTRDYYDCVFQSKFSDPLDCLYKARGIDRSARQPALKYRQVGDYGGYEALANSAVEAIYQGADPRTTIHGITLAHYLRQRDQAFEMAHEVPPGDDRSPVSRRTSSVDAGGTTYWVVEQDYSELKLIKIMHEDDAGIGEVVCARFGPADGFGIDTGYCAAMIKDHFGVSLDPRSD
jgi:hypothetical protein